jgi:hypothetical protein
MAHRNGKGEKIEDLQAARDQWFAENRTATTYCGVKEWDAWQENFGELIEKFADGEEIRQHATVKASCRGGSRKIIHNCVIIGDPTGWTYYGTRDIDIARWVRIKREQVSGMERNESC